MDPPPPKWKSKKGIMSHDDLRARVLDAIRSDPALLEIVRSGSYFNLNQCRNLVRPIFCDHAAIERNALQVFHYFRRANRAELFMGEETGTDGHTPQHSAQGSASEAHLSTALAHKSAATAHESATMAHESAAAAVLVEPADGVMVEPPAADPSSPEPQKKEKTEAAVEEAVLPARRGPVVSIS